MQFTQISRHVRPLKPTTQVSCPAPTTTYTTTKPALQRSLHYPPTPVPTPPLCSSSASTTPTTSTVPNQWFDELAASRQRKYIMISGKGGVGKTSLAASLALQLAQEGHNVLVVSTDPAHSLSDSLEQDVSGGKPVPIEGTALPVWGMEVDPEEAKEEFRKSQKTAGAGSIGNQVTGMLKAVGLGGIVDQIAALKLGELLDTPPPGLDEGVAIAKVVQFVNKEEYEKFSRIVFDTAPTGHTLRLLTLPDFLEASLGKLIRIRQKLKAASDVLRNLFNVGSQENALDKLEQAQEQIRVVRDLFRDKNQTEFIIATIPTILGINESARLLQTLNKEQVPCKRIIVNQMITTSNASSYLEQKLKDQQRALEVYARTSSLSQMKRVVAPLLDWEVRGVPALQYFGGMIWSKQIEEMGKVKDDNGPRFFIMGGKGGVGKTSCSTSLGAALAGAGHKVLVVSTDPAHSLSDSLDQDVSGGLPVQVEAPGGGDFSMWAMEVDIDEARRELKEATKGTGGKQLVELLNKAGLGWLAEQVADLQLDELLETPPPGVDELVALSKVLAFLKQKEQDKFTHIVLDTAPTGHTVRLLTLPDFINNTLDKVVLFRDNMAKASSLGGLFKGSEEQQASQEEAMNKIKALKERVKQAGDLFRNKEQTEFIIVTIPTVMAIKESGRLASLLRDQSVKTDRIIINQLLEASSGDKFLQMKKQDQVHAIQALQQDKGLNDLQLLLAPQVDVEVKGVGGLTYFGGKVWRQD